MECWRLFVIASRLLSKHSITDVDIAAGDALLLEFCKAFETEYGKSCVTPNMHMEWSKAGKGEGQEKGYAIQETEISSQAQA